MLRERAKPDFIVLDEPTSSLDVSVQAKILNLLKIAAWFRTAFMFISRNIGVVRYLSDRIAVMYPGRIVEIASNDDLFASPQNPYTQALLAAIPARDPTLKKQSGVER